MPHDVSLITLLAAGFGLALVLGFLALRARLPALVGYLVAGMIIGPFTPGFVADAGLAQQLAEIGVILLMFGVGMHFSFKDLLAVRRIAVPGAFAQIAVATLLGMAVAKWWWGWSTSAGLVFGLSLSVASTVVLLRALEDRGLLDSTNGSIAVGWLVVEDIATVIVLVLLPAIAGVFDGSSTSNGTSGIWKTLGITLAQVALFVILMLAIGRRVLPWFLWQVSGTGSRELFTLAVIACGLGIAYGASHLFGVSFALGAFFAGTVMRESSLSHRAARESLPLRDAFSVLFFVSVGMLFDPSVITREPLRLLTVLAIIVIGKASIAFGIVLAFRYPLNTALTVSASLAQIGEFSFILAGLGVSLGLMPEEGHSLLLAAAILSIAINPPLFHAIEPVQRWIRGRSEHARRFEQRSDPLAQLPVEVRPEELTGHVVLIGYGRVGKRIAGELRGAGIPFVVVEENREVVSRMRGERLLAVSGDATDLTTLIQAHVTRASVLVIAMPDVRRARTTVDLARRLNPSIEIIARTHSDEETELMIGEKVNRVFMGESELAHSMTRHLLDRFDRATDYLPSKA